MMLATFALQSSGFRRKLKGVFDLWKKIQMADKIRNHSVPMTLLQSIPTAIPVNDPTFLLTATPVCKLDAESSQNRRTSVSPNAALSVTTRVALLAFACFEYSIWLQIIVKCLGNIVTKAL